jgi:hypothetical protein
VTLLPVVLAVRDFLALFEHVFFRLFVGNTGWCRGLPAILGVMVRVLVVGVLVLGIAVDARCHGCEFCWPAPGTQPVARASTGHAPPAEESRPGGCAMMTWREGGRAVVVHRFAELIAPSRLGRSFRWLLASSWLTNLGDGITLAAGPLLVASQTRNPLAVAMAAFLQRLPWLLFGLYAGVLADRLDRGVGRHRAVLVRLRRIGSHSRPDLAVAAPDRARRRANPGRRPAARLSQRRRARCRPRSAGRPGGRRRSAWRPPARGAVPAGSGWPGPRTALRPAARCRRSP